MKLFERYLLGESINILYKPSFTASILEAVSAYANFHDGVIVLGVTDQGVITGVEDPEATQRQIENAINDGLDPVPEVEIQKVPVASKTVLLVKVFKGIRTPYQYHQKAYKPTDTSAVTVDRHANVELILQGHDSSFEELVAAEQNLGFRDLEKRLKKEMGIQTLTEDLLIALRLKKNGRYNQAAALLADESPMESLKIQLIAYFDETALSIRDLQTVDRMSVVNLFDECIKLYHKHLNVRDINEGSSQEAVEEIPLAAYRAAVANMLLQRNYARREAARIEIFSDRVETFSPGGLPLGISEEEYVQGRIPVIRNPIVADVFSRLNLIEKQATGIRRIRASYRDAAVKPAFHVTDHSILVVLPRISAGP